MTTRSGLEKLKTRTLPQKSISPFSFFSFLIKRQTSLKNQKFRSNPSRAFFANANPCPAPGWICVSNPFAALKYPFNGTANNSSVHNPAQNIISLSPVATSAAPWIHSHYFAQMSDSAIQAPQLQKAIYFSLHTPLTQRRIRELWRIG